MVWEANEISLAAGRDVIIPVPLASFEVLDFRLHEFLPVSVA
jgi:hypothetical protein